MRPAAPESALSARVSAWLRMRALRVFAEVPIQGCATDLIAVDETIIVAVELKCSLSTQVIRQALRNQTFADESWCATRTRRPRHLGLCRQNGIGVICCDGDELDFLLYPTGNRCHSGSRELLKRVLKNRTEGGTGGVQTICGDGPAQEVARAVAPLRKAGVPWRQIFSQVSTHYANHRSLASAMNSYAPARAILDGA